MMWFVIRLWVLFVGKRKADPHYIPSLFVFSTNTDAQMQAKTRHERFLKRRQNLLDIAVCDKHDTPNEQQNNNDMDESDEQLKNDNTCDEDESLIDI